MEILKREIKRVTLIISGVSRRPELDFDHLSHPSELDKNIQNWDDHSLVSQRACHQQQLRDESNERPLQTVTDSTTVASQSLPFVSSTNLLDFDDDDEVIEQKSGAFDDLVGLDLVKTRVAQSARRNQDAESDVRDLDVSQHGAKQEHTQVADLGDLRGGDIDETRECVS